MYDIKAMKNLKPAYNKNLIYTRLGCDKNHTELSGQLYDEVEKLIKKAEDTLSLTGAYRIMGIDRIDPPKVILEDGTVFSGTKLAELMKDCDQALIMLATGGSKIMELINKLQKEGKMSEAVVIDAAASEITDSVLDMVMLHVGQILRSKGKVLTNRRFSPGYGDFDIEQQKKIYRLMNGVSFGITLNEACLLLPEKSVFAVAGISGGHKYNDKERI